MLAAPPRVPSSSQHILAKAGRSRPQRLSAAWALCVPVAVVTHAKVSRRAAARICNGHCRRTSHTRLASRPAPHAEALVASTAAAVLLVSSSAAHAFEIPDVASFFASGEEQIERGFSYAYKTFAKPQWKDALRLDEKARWRKVSSSVLLKIRQIARLLAELEADIVRGDWTVIGTYPQVLLAYTDIFTKYTDTAFSGDDPVDKALRFELRFEVGQFSQARNTLADAVKKQDERLAQFAFAELSLSYDRYLKAGELYQGTDAVTNTELLYQTKSGEKLAIKFEPPLLEPPQLRDKITVINGPDKGKSGEILWIGEVDDKPKFSIVKLGFNEVIGAEEVKTFPYEWLARTESTSETLVTDAVAAFTASVLACTVVYPIDTAKVRSQGGDDPIPSAEEGGPIALYDGLVLNLGRESPNAAISIGIFHYLTRVFLASFTPVLSPYFDMNNPAARDTVMLPAAAIGDAVGTVVRVPFELLNKQIQCGTASTNAEAFDKVFFSPGAPQLYAASWTSILIRDVPYGTLYLTFFEIAKDNLAVPLTRLDIPQFGQEALWGLLAAYTAALITIPFDVVATRVITKLEGGAAEKADVSQTLNMVIEVSQAVWDEEGVNGFFVGAQARAIYYGFCGAIFWSLYESFLKVL
eukprot:TRINITY_DN89665_c0_g1_i1.p1 TRINITY_DN89665_c0_g1~~TRINITY_DN89665_c0_g1_i1.p1  ORF type:complete len:648 (+),score=117.91 TRINITY_DN89665_c0_g1_i1:26-1945(+)